MSESLKHSLENAASILKRQHAEITIDTFLKFLATLDIITRYLDLQYTSEQATRSGFNVLNTLVLYGGAMSPTEISKKIYRSKNAVGHVVATLESRGLVATVPDSGDRRSKEVRITPKGLALTAEASIIKREHLGAQLFDVLEAEEITCLNTVLEKLLQRTRKLIDEGETIT